MFAEGGYTLAGKEDPGGLGTLQGSPKYLFCLGIGENVEAVEARHGQSAGMHCPAISSSF